MMFMVYFFQNLKITDELSEGNYGIGEYHETHRPAVVENDNVQPNVSYGQRSNIKLMRQE